jgi:D-glycero-beta-D-manno-heptose-7-phosphate kinase
MRDQPVLMLVDMVADRFISGIPKRISREAPVLILQYQGETLSPGGGANAVANVRSLGGRPLPVGVVGEDASGAGLLAELEVRGVSTEGILRKNGFATPTKTRVLAGGKHSIKQQIVRFDVEDRLSLDDAERQTLRRKIALHGGGSQVAVLSDYGYGAVEPALVADLRAALTPGGVVLCDSRHRLRDFSGMDGATPNEEEAEALLRSTIEDDLSRLERDGRRLLEELEARFLLITRGSRGMVLFDQEGAVHVPVFGTDQVADVTGAGDTVIGTFALALAAGATPFESALLANYAGGLVVMKMGTATLTPEELRRAVETGSMTSKELRWARW